MASWSPVHKPRIKVCFSDREEGHQLEGQGRRDTLPLSRIAFFFLFFYSGASSRVERGKSPDDRDRAGQHLLGKVVWLFVF